MRQGKCEGCGRSFGLNELVSVFGETVCEGCSGGRLEGVPKEQITGERVYRLSDPTVCARCGADGGQIEYETVLEMPVCDSCCERLRRYPFPMWIKAACAGLAALVIFTVLWNWRFLEARVLMDRGMKAGFVEGRLAEGAKRMEKAANLVPESADLAALSCYMSGIVQLQEDNCEKALELFGKCSLMPASVGVDELKKECRIGIAFDKKDYREFLRLSLELEQVYPESSRHVAQVSSAYACLYAEGGDEADKDRAMEYLGRAEKLSGAADDGVLGEYKERILHRLKTREVISRKEYYERMGKPLPEDEQ